MSHPFPDELFDYVLVGGGLQNALITLAVLERHPSARIAVVERDSRIAGNHTWSFHEDDVSVAAQSFLAPLVVSRWPGYRVRFADRERRLAIPYASISSERVREVVERALSRSGCQLLTNAAASRVEADGVVLTDGTRLSGKVVVDARGPAEFTDSGASGYQKFVGLELLLDRPSPLTEPLIMDARVPQTDGFRFFYVLPFERDRVLIEDTYFSDSPELDVEEVSAHVLKYALEHGFSVARVLRSEQGVLPLPLSVRPLGASTGPLLGGVQGGWFHPTTGYSLPVALRLAEYLASVPPEDVFGAGLAELVDEQHRQARFAAFLNRLLFTCYAPERRAPVLERFYGFSEPVVRRFYALRTTSWDRARILFGRPPRGFSLRRALSGSARA